MRAAALALALALCGSASCGSPAGSATNTQALVFGSRAALLHAAPGGGPALSARALQQLALDALGIDSASRRAAGSWADAPAPLQADAFRKVGAYALVLAEDAAAPARVAAAVDQYFGEAFSQLLPAAGPRLDTAATALAASASKAGSPVLCAGSDARCADVLGAEATARAAGADLLRRQFEEHEFLDRDVQADAAFAQELAKVAELTDALARQPDDSPALFVVAFSDPSPLGGKRDQAQEAVTTKVMAFLAALQSAHPLVGAQVVPVKPIDGVTSTQRQLQDADEDSEADEEEEEEEEEEEDEDELELEAETGSGSNSTTKTNAKSPITTQDIAEFQIVLWTSVLLGVMLLLAVVAMGNMDVGRDSLLYAKFTTGAGHRKSD